MLPRLPCMADTIKVNLKRKLQYKSSALSLNIRPYKVVQAADWLMRNSSLYSDEGIVVNPEWANQYNEEILPHEDESNDIADEQSLIVNENRDNIESNNVHVDAEDEWSEDEAEIPAGVTDDADGMTQCYLQCNSQTL